MYIPHSESEKEEMLRSIGISSLEDLFQAVPAQHRFPKLNLPSALTEMEASTQMQDIASANETVREMSSFLGAGAYNHYIPSAVDMLLRRGEFYTAYTPYQPEVSQGTLQAVFEYQTLIANLTGMDVSNASHYDGATATAEAGILAYHQYRGKRKKFLVSPSVNPQYRDVLCTYLCGYEDISIQGGESTLAPWLTPDELISMVDKDTAMVVVQYPDFFGRVFDLTRLADAVHAAGAMLTVAVNPTALGMLTPPGKFGADIVVGEGQPLGIPVSFGGPYLGIFTTRDDFVRKIAGRLVGETVDHDGRRGYVLTLTAREQHIRREKATSNICTNQGLMALAATIYLSLLGKSGLRKVAELCYHKAHYAAQKINAIPGYSVDFSTPFFHEFVVKCPMPVDEINDQLLDHNILGGFDLSREYTSLKNHMLVAVTEMNSREEIDALCEVLQEVSHE